jgi:hypothetical protein
MAKLEGITRRNTKTDILQLRTTERKWVREGIPGKESAKKSGKNWP